jgi:hypothetical protein
MCPSAGAADAQPDRAAPRAADRGLRAGSPGVRPRRISAELAREKWGWAADLRARRLAHAGRVGAEHARQAPGLGRASPRSLRARPLAPPRFHEQDQLENAIHDRVCDDAQALLAPATRRQGLGRAPPRPRGLSGHRGDRLKPWSPPRAARPSPRQDEAPAFLGERQPARLPVSLSLRTTWRSSSGSARHACFARRMRASARIRSTRSILVQRRRHRRPSGDCRSSRDATVGLRHSHGPTHDWPPSHDGILHRWPRHRGSRRSFSSTVRSWVRRAGCRLRASSSGAGAPP